MSVPPTNDPTGAAPEGQPPLPGQPAQPWAAQPPMQQPPMQAPGQPGAGAPPYGAVPPGYGPASTPTYQPGGASVPSAFPTYAAMPTDVVGDTDQSSKRGGKSFLPWLIGLVVVALIGGGVFAVQAAMSSDPDQPASVLPASAIMYGRLDVDPSAGQKIQALRLLNKFPAFRDSVDLPDINADLREKMFDAVKGDSPELADLDYDADVAPWLGNRIGFAMIPGDDDADPNALLAMQVTDTDKAKTGLTKLLETGDGTGGFVITDGYALIAETTELAQQYADEAAKSALSDNDDFTASMNDLGDQGIASFWVSEDAYALLADATSGMADGITGGMADGMASGLTGVTGETAPGSLSSMEDLGLLGGSQAFAVRFGDRYLEIASAQQRGDLGLTPSTTTNPAAKLPESTLFEFSLANGKETIDNAWAKLSELASASDSTFTRDIRRFEKQTGLSILDDIGTLLGDGFTFAVDNQDFSSLEDPADLRIGALLDTDVDAAQGILDTLLANVPDSAGFNLTRVESDGLLAVSTNEDYASEMSTGSLGDTEAYKLAVLDGSTASSTMFFNFDLLEGSTLDLLEQQGVTQEVIDNLTALQAFGVSSNVDGDGVTHAALRVVVN